MNYKHILFFTLIFTATINAQESPVTIREALMLKAVDYYRNINRMDPVEARIVFNKWKAPHEGDEVDLGERNISQWRKVVADSTGWFNEEDLRGGYAYIPIHSDREKVMILEGLGYRLAYFNGELRSGNMYGYQENWEPWQPHFDFCFLPVLLKPGRNDLLVFGARVPRFKVRIHEPESEIFLNIKDTTLPDLLVGNTIDAFGAVVVVNASRKPVKNLQLIATLEDGKEVRNIVPIIQPLSVRKVGFKFSGIAPTETGSASRISHFLMTQKSCGFTKMMETGQLAKRYILS
ncbi:hypothetical protein KC799_25400 [candidate division KSB1 bacterium]|nr:hypothetical protein [candidate division KSB1 bacterium]